MPYFIRRCEFEIDNLAYIRFLLQHHDQLNLPYSFAAKLSFVSGPLIFGKALLIYSEEPYEVVGAAGFVYGTGADEFQNREVCQLEAVFLRKEARNGRLFRNVMTELLHAMKEGSPDVRTVQFWAVEGHKAYGSLLSKLARLPEAQIKAVNDLSLYSLSVQQLERYCDRIRIMD